MKFIICLIGLMTTTISFAQEVTILVNGRVPADDKTILALNDYLEVKIKTEKYVQYKFDAKAGKTESEWEKGSVSAEQWVEKQHLARGYINVCYAIKEKLEDSKTEDTCLQFKTEKPNFLVENSYAKKTKLGERLTDEEIAEIEINNGSLLKAKNFGQTVSKTCETNNN